MGNNPKNPQNQGQGQQQNRNPNMGGGQTWDKTKAPAGQAGTRPSTPTGGQGQSHGGMGKPTTNTTNTPYNKK